jgi:hypothetical protein
MAQTPNADKTETYIMKGTHHNPTCNAQTRLPEPDKEAWSAPTLRLLSVANTRSGKRNLHSGEATTSYGNTFGNAS